MIDLEKSYPSRLVTRIVLFGLGLVLSLAGLVLFFWMIVVEPQLRSAEQTKIDLLAPFYAQSISSVLLISNQHKRLAELEVQTSEILVKTDLVTGQPMFEGLQIELANERILVDQPPEEGFSGFISESLLVSQTTGKTLGLLRLFYSNTFFEHIRSSALDNLLLWLCSLLALLVIFWRLLINQIKPLIDLSSALQGLDLENTAQRLPSLKPATSLEIVQVKNAINDLMDKMLKSKVRVLEKTQDLNESNRALESFLYTVAHDLRIPLRTLDGFSHLLEEEYGHLLDETGLSYLKNIQDGGRDMHALIEGLLALSRTMKSALTPIQVNLAGLAHEVTKELEQANPNLSKTINIAPKITGYGDPALLRTLLEHLLGNAWKFTAHTPDARIEFSCEERDGETIFKIADNGSGFDMAHKEMLFRPFYKLHKPGEFEGSGVGLSLAQRIIERHGGHIWAEAEVGEGATFFFTLKCRGVDWYKEKPFGACRLEATDGGEHRKSG